MSLDQEKFLQDFHRRFPSCTSSCFSLGFTQNGLTTYDLLIKDLKELNGALLDLACGDGYLLALMANKRNGCDLLYGIDMSQGELEVAWRNESLISKNILIGNAKELPFISESLHGVSCHMALMLMSDVQEVIGEVYRVLKPGGKFVAIVPGPSASDHVFQIYKDWLSQNLDVCSLEWLKQLSDKRISSESDLKKLFKNFSDFKIETEVIHYEFTAEQMVQYCSQFYASGLMDENKQKKLRCELLLAYQELKVPQLKHVYPVYHMLVTK